MSPANPTAKTYAALNRAFDFFNDRLFGGELPPCLVTLQRKNKAYGYFAGGRFGSKDGAEITDEIALNPSHFKSRTDEQSLSTLVHEMRTFGSTISGSPRGTATTTRNGRRRCTRSACTLPTPADLGGRKQASHAAITSSRPAPTPVLLPSWPLNLTFRPSMSSFGTTPTPGRSARRSRPARPATHARTANFTPGRSPARAWSVGSATSLWRPRTATMVNRP